MMLLEEAGKLWGGKPMTEAEALQSGLLEPYPDGKIHLDWPMSRGMAARILARLLQRTGFPASFSRAFPDVATMSAAAPALELIGQAFRPLANDRFCADHVFSPEDLRYAMDSLGRQPPIARSSEIRPFLGFSERDAMSASSALKDAMASDVQRLGRLAPWVPPEQLAPQAAFNLEAAAEGVGELEGSLDSFELTIYDVTLADPQDASLGKEVREFLTGMRPVLRDLSDKLRLSRKQLQSALLVDPESIRQAAGLKTRIGTALFRLEQLSDRVEKRLPTISPKGTDE